MEEGENAGHTTSSPSVLLFKFFLTILGILFPRPVWLPNRKFIRLWILTIVNHQTKVNRSTSEYREVVTITLVMCSAKNVSGYSRPQISQMRRDQDCGLRIFFLTLCNGQDSCVFQANQIIFFSFHRELELQSFLLEENNIQSSKFLSQIILFIHNRKERLYFLRCIHVFEVPRPLYGDDVFCF